MLERERERERERESLISLKPFYFRWLKEAADIVGIQLNEKIKWKKLGEICERQRGISITAKKMKELDNPNGEIKVFAGGNTVAYLTSENVREENIINIPSIIVKSRGNIDFEFYDKFFTHKNEMWSYRVKNSENVNIKYLYYYLINNLQYFRDRAISGKLPQISIGVTDNYTLPLPSLKVQNYIVSILDKFDALINDIAQGLPKEIEARQKQYEYYRDKLLNFPR